ncbi:MAG: NifB/NifX family molybdenum-iron cluster-binding protein [Candidatus Hadarchaeum sp.]|uniref:NifB/NifX family molybdenum-iron cluster-binding protein n=1 Tax=Candidatus Hadarchaeum sp. TaxID=2883567 RepID=UPI003D0C511A
MAKVKVAIATKGQKGLGDEVADHFAKAETFTIATVEGKKVHLEIMKNPAAGLSRGRGRVVVQKLKEFGVDVVVAAEIGLGALSLLKEEKLKVAKVHVGTKVIDVIRDELYKKHFSA